MKKPLLVVVAILAAVVALAVRAKVRKLEDEAALWAEATDQVPA